MVLSDGGKYLPQYPVKCPYAKMASDFSDQNSTGLSMIALKGASFVFVGLFVFCKSCVYFNTSIIP